MARTTGSKKIGGKHMQHTTKFINEVNSVNTNSFNPFRYYDEVWIVGKYKGKKLKETPRSYIEWAINNMKLSETALSILKSI